MDECSRNESIGVNPLFQMKSDHTGDPVVEYEVSRPTTDTLIVVINKVCLELLSLLQH